MYERKDIPSMNETPRKSDSERGHMTTARSRAIALLDDMTGHAYQQSCTAFVDAVLSAAEGRTRKTSTSSRDEDHVHYSPPGSDTLQLCGASGCMSCNDLSRVDCPKCIALAKSSAAPASSLATNVMSPDGTSVLGKLVPPSAFAAAPASSDGRPDREALGRKAYEAWCAADGNSALPWGWKPEALGKQWEAWRVIAERLYEMGRKDWEARIAMLGSTLNRLTADYRKETSRLEDMAAHHEKGHNDAVARAESASRERDAALARAEAAEAKAQRRLDALYEVAKSCRIGASPDPPEVAVPRGVREMLEQSVAWTDREKLQAAEARVRELESAVRDLYARKSPEGFYAVATGSLDRLFALVRPTAPTADDGDEKEKST